LNDRLATAEMLASDMALMPVLPALASQRTSGWAAAVVWLAASRCSSMEDESFPQEDVVVLVAACGDESASRSSCG
jgi:hypothetical protein